MTRSILSVFVLFAIFAFTPAVVTDAGAQPRTTAGTAVKGRSPNTTARRPPSTYIDSASPRGTRSARFHMARMHVGKTMTKPITNIRGSGEPNSGARGGGLNERAGAPRRNASATRGDRGAAAATPSTLPWSYYNRAPKTVPKRLPNGRNVTFRSTKSAPLPPPRTPPPPLPPRPSSLTSDVSVLLPRIPTGPRLAIALSGAGQNNARAPNRENRSINQPRNIQVLQSQMPRTERQKGLLTRWGRVKRFFSTKQSG